MKYTKGHLSFVEFLDDELPKAGLIHQYTGTSGYRPYYNGHEIIRVTVTNERFLFFKYESTKEEVVAQIEAEPDNVVEDGKSDCLRIKVFDKSLLNYFSELALRFETLFQMGSEIVY